MCRFRDAMWSGFWRSSARLDKIAGLVKSDVPLDGGGHLLEFSATRASKVPRPLCPVRQPDPGFSHGILMTLDSELERLHWKAGCADASVVVTAPVRCGEEDDFDEDDENLDEHHEVQGEDDFDEDDFDDDFDDDFEEELEEEELIASDEDVAEGGDDVDEDPEFEDDED